jgi:hypothetical protein
MDISKTTQNIVLVVVGIVVILLIFVALIPTLNTALNTMNTSGFPLASIFITIVPILLVVGLLVGIIYAALSMVKHKK